YNIFVKEKDLITNVKKIRLRRAGTFIFGEAFVELNPFAGVQDLREEQNILQKQILDLNPYIKDFSILSVIPQLEKARVAIPIKEGNNLNAILAPTLPSTRAYLFADISDSRVLDFYIKQI